MEFFTEFPEMGRQDLRDFKKAVDASFKSFSRNYGDAIESFFEPLLWFLVWLERLRAARQDGVHRTLVAQLSRPFYIVS